MNHEVKATMSESNSVAEESIETLSMTELLAEKPPGQFYNVPQAFRPGSANIYLTAPPIKVFCADKDCQTETFFDPSSPSMACNIHGKATACQDFFIYYRCRHCTRTNLTFVVRAVWTRGSASGKIVKFGQWPPYGPHTPPRLFSILGKDQELFLKGRRAESQNLGIAAFSYYRRVVENQKNRLLDELIRIAELVSAPSHIAEELKAAKSERQFQKAINGVQPAVPESLLIEGYNPFVLLYRALSKGLHSDSDEVCLQSAQSIRVVLTELAEKIGAAASEKKELKDAVTRLAKMQDAATGEIEPTRSDGN